MDTAPQTALTNLELMLIRKLATAAKAVSPYSPDHLSTVHLLADLALEHFGALPATPEVAS